MQSVDIRPSRLTVGAKGALGAAGGILGFGVSSVEAVRFGLQVGHDIFPKAHVFDQNLATFGKDFPDLLTVANNAPLGVREAAVAVGTVLSTYLLWQSLKLAAHGMFAWETAFSRREGFRNMTNPEDGGIKGFKNWYYRRGII